mmetsp:Transcript_19738/g.50253  ORF Transcript_19738/g.50253 Transcript_19738/m.50253 type:complete len:109 (-) Transcript_19738:880-1206(-)
MRLESVTLAPMTAGKRPKQQPLSTLRLANILYVPTGEATAPSITEAASLCKQIGCARARFSHSKTVSTCRGIRVAHLLGGRSGATFLMCADAFPRLVCNMLRCRRMGR